MSKYTEDLCIKNLAICRIPEAVTSATKLVQATGYDNLAFVTSHRGGIRLEYGDLGCPSFIEVYILLPNPSNYDCLFGLDLNDTSTWVEQTCPDINDVLTIYRRFFNVDKN